ncbi:MAG: SsrA-binding protein SmpB [Acidobacteria bacterium]|nr:MAG: SsrA-binding protein SmpB [Acidobacteriota bacterium]
MSKDKSSFKRLAANRRARHNYHILDKLEAGIALLGTEVKAVREGKIQLKDSYIEIKEGEAYLVGAHISPYSHGNRQNHDPDRPRKLLLKRREIDKLFGRITLQGQTCIPLSVYLKGNLIKLEIALAKGKKLYDKRQAEKARILDKEAREAVVDRRR